jgi:hypothetical protein
VRGRPPSATDDPRTVRHSFKAEEERGFVVRSSRSGLPALGVDRLRNPVYPEAPDLLPSNAKTRLVRGCRRCRRRDSNPRHADYDGAAPWLYRAKNRARGTQKGTHPHNARGQFRVSIQSRAPGPRGRGHVMNNPG